MVSQTNFLDSDKVKEVYHNIRIYDNSFIAIGKANSGGIFTGYAFTLIVDFLEPKHTDFGPDIVGNMILPMTIHVLLPTSLSRASSFRSFGTGSVPSLSISTTLSYSFSTSAGSQPDSPLLIESSYITRVNTPDSTMSDEDFQTLRGDRPINLHGRGRICYGPEAREIEQKKSDARCNGLRQFFVYQGRWSAASRDYE
ncbi:alcohol dehydrogenase [Fusarium agapanthi]|uniref:Alcohol dehydrogenase n=1 Tax=Fusarium agapanthi TaxID=1803897 RepID=A0A9P5B5D8_9HYPO|nr:alcohol dehydrogenase [Fusarium agapanthi]